MKFRDVLVGILLEINQEKYKDFDMINSKEKVLYEDTKSTIQHIDYFNSIYKKFKKNIRK